MKDLTVEILREIRDEIRSTRVDLGSRIDATNQRLDATNQGLDATNERLDRLERQQISAEIHLATELVAVAGAIELVRQELVKDRDLRGAVADHEARIRRLEGAATHGP